MGITYLIALASPLGTPGKHTARYYLGSCKNLEFRLQQHQNGTGSAMLRAANDRGISYQVVKTHRCKTEKQARALERRLKRFKNHAYILNRDWSKYIE